MARDFALNRYAELLELPIDHPLCINMEKSTHNWAVKQTQKSNDTPATDNPRHMSRYKHKFLEMQKNLKNSPNLKQRILSGELKTSQVFELPLENLWPGGIYAKACEEGIKRAMAKDYNIANEPDYKGLFRCNKCKGYKTTYYEMQTRSADEPMTVFVTCHVCKLTWKS